MDSSASAIPPLAHTHAFLVHHNAATVCLLPTRYSRPNSLRVADTHTHLECCQYGGLLHLLKVLLHAGGVSMEHILNGGLNLQGGHLLSKPVLGAQKVWVCETRRACVFVCVWMYECVCVQTSGTEIVASRQVSSSIHLITWMRLSLLLFLPFTDLDASKPCWASSRVAATWLLRLRNLLVRARKDSAYCCS